MTQMPGPGRARSLSGQITDLEHQLMLRRQRVRTLVTGIRQKVTTPLATPAALVVAVGIGVAMEQTSHQKGWSLVTVLDAADAGIRLLQSFRASDAAGR